MDGDSLMVWWVWTNSSESEKARLAVLGIVCFVGMFAYVAVRALIEVVQERSKNKDLRKRN